MVIKKANTLYEIFKSSDWCSITVRFNQGDFFIQSRKDEYTKFKFKYSALRYGSNSLDTFHYLAFPEDLRKLFRHLSTDPNLPIGLDSFTLARRTSDGGLRLERISGKVEGAESVAEFSKKEMYTIKHLAQIVGQL